MLNNFFYELLFDQLNDNETEKKESVGCRLQWHTVVVTPFTSITYCPLYFIAVLTSVFVRLLN